MSPDKVPHSEKNIKNMLPAPSKMGRLMVWTKTTHHASGLQTTLDPVTLHDGDNSLGPRWSKVVYRVTRDFYNGNILDNISTKGVSIEEATGPIHGAKRGKTRSIITEFYYPPGAWIPPDHELKNVKAATEATPVPPPANTAFDPGSVNAAPTFSKDVQESMAAIGCNLRDRPITPAMPLLSEHEVQRLRTEHREKNPEFHPIPFNALVARPVDRKERNATPEALEAVAKEWKRLRSIKHRDGIGVWDETKVDEKRNVVADARRRKITVHFARIFDLCVEKGSELPPGDKDRKYKGAGRSPG